VRRSLAIGTALLTALTLPVVVLAADSNVDPQASSPAGAVYEIPLQTARDFGAPGGGGHATGGGGSGGGRVLPNGSAVKSENGYGSSTQVPGLTAAAVHKAATSNAKAHASSSSGHRHASTTSGRTRASAAAAAASVSAAPAPPRISARRAASDAPSLTGTYGLIILIALGGAAAGIAASLAARSSFRTRG